LSHLTPCAATKSHNSGVSLAAVLNEPDL